MSYDELCDDIVSALRSDAQFIGVNASSIVEGGREASPPSVNVFIEPAVDSDTGSHPANTPGFIRALVRLVCLSGRNRDDSHARREAFRVCLNSCKVVGSLAYIDSLQDMGFADTNADASVCMAEFSTLIEFIF